MQCREKGLRRRGYHRLRHGRSRRADLGSHCRRGTRGSGRGARGATGPSRSSARLAVAPRRLHEDLVGGDDQPDGLPGQQHRHPLHRGRRAGSFGVAGGPAGHSPRCCRSSCSRSQPGHGSIECGVGRCSSPAISAGRSPCSDPDRVRARRANDLAAVRSRLRGRPADGLLRRRRPVVSSCAARSRRPGRGQRQAADLGLGRADRRPRAWRRDHQPGRRSVRGDRRCRQLPGLWQPDLADPKARSPQACRRRLAHEPAPGDRRGPAIRPRQPVPADDRRLDGHIEPGHQPGLLDIRRLRVRATAAHTGLDRAGIRARQHRYPGGSDAGGTVVEASWRRAGRRSARCS